MWGVRRTLGGAPATALAVTSVIVVSSLVWSAPDPTGAAATVTRRSAPRAAAAESRVAERIAPTISWTSCGDVFGPLPGFACAAVAVPLDHDEPEGATVDLALARYAASRPGRRIGTLFVNPGGPGGSGVQLVGMIGPLLDSALGGRFDIVGFDPRGVGESSPIECFASMSEMSDFWSLRGRFPSTRRREAAYFDHWTTLFGRCADRSGPVLRHMGTANVARDLDLLRQAVGDDKLTYLGFSYGTYLGQVYANLFPRRVRAMALDGVLDPVAFTRGRQIDYDETGTQKVMDEFLRLCDEAAAVDRSACRLSRGRGGAAQRWNDLVSAVRREPVDVPNGPLLDEAALIAVVASVLYSPGQWAVFANEVAALLRMIEAAASGRRADVVPDLSAGRWSPERRSADGGAMAFQGNHCADAKYPTSFERWQRRSARARDASAFAPLWWWQTAACASWPVDTDRYTGPWTPTSKAPILLVANQFDPSTPIEGARAASALIRNDRLVTYEGYGHIAWGTSRCATRLTNAYLRTATLPDPSVTTCRAPENPFLDATPFSTARAALDQVLSGRVPGP